MAKTNTAPKQTAANRRAHHMKAAYKALDEIKAAMLANKIDQPGGRSSHWGDVGDAEFLAQQLTALADRLLSRGEYADDAK